MRIPKILFVVAMLGACSADSTNNNSVTERQLDGGLDVSGDVRVEPDDGNTPVDMGPAEDVSTVDVGEDARADAIVEPGFTLVPIDPNIRVRRSGSASFTVGIERVGDFNSEVSVAVDGLPNGVSVASVTIPVAANEATLNFEAFPSAQHAGPLPVTVRGVALDDLDITDEFAVDFYVAGAPGALDTSFSFDGVVTHNVSAESDAARQMALDDEGRIIVAGESQGGISNAFVVRFRGDGSLDTTFGQSGVVQDFPGSRSGIRGFATDGNAMVISAFSTDTDIGFYLRKLDSDGAVEESFGGGNDVSFPDDYKLGGPVKWNARYLIWDFTSLLSFDSEGSEDATLVAPDPLPLSAVGAVVPYDDRLYVAGIDRGTNEYKIIRLSPNGALDGSFAGSGIAEFGGPAGTTVEAVKGLALAPDGSGVAIVEADHGGSFSENDVLLLRFDETGLPNQDFGSGGQLVVHDKGIGIDLAVEDNGNVVAVYSEPVSDFALDAKIARFLPDGALDAGFGTGGVVDVDPTFFNDVVHDKAANRLLLVESSSGEFTIRRIWL